MEMKFPLPSPRNSFQMKQPSLVIEEKKWKAKPRPKVNKQLFEKFLRFEGK